MGLDERAIRKRSMGRVQFGASRSLAPTGFAGGGEETLFACLLLSETIYVLSFLLFSCVLGNPLGFGLPSSSRT